MEVNLRNARNRRDRPVIDDGIESISFLLIGIAVEDQGEFVLSHVDAQAEGSLHRRHLGGVEAQVLADFQLHPINLGQEPG